MASEEYGTGRCVNCGFLCKINENAAVSGCYEATAPDRYTGHLAEYQATLGLQRFEQFAIPTIPWCFRSKANFIKELSELGATVHDDAKIHEVIRRQRDCSFWMLWKEFIGPKEHYEEFKMLELEQRREQFEQQMEKDRRAFELKLEELNREERKRTNKVMIWLAIAAIVFAAAEVVAALLGLTNDSWILHFFR